MQCKTVPWRRHVTEWGDRKVKHKQLSICGRLLTGIVVLLFVISTLVGCSELTESIPISERTNAQTVTDIVEEYHRDHTYSKYDLFVCSDMAIDVWNMVETQGINANIAVGNVDNPNVGWEEYNHAWVLAETSPNQWLALETTGGRVVYSDENQNYYKAYCFSNPKEFKRYLELINEYDSQISRVNGLRDDYSNTFTKYELEREYYNALVSGCNSKYAGRPISAASQACRDRAERQLAVAKESEGRLRQLSEIIDNETRVLMEINNQMIGLLQ